MKNLKDLVWAAKQTYNNSRNALSWAETKDMDAMKTSLDSVERDAKEALELVAKIRAGDLGEPGDGYGFQLS